MSFDKEALSEAIARHGRVARVVVAATQGSVPREVGAAMLVWEGGQSGTIGGGTLEFEAANRAFDAPRLQRLPLGPAMGQCCGGAVTLLTEIFENTVALPDDIYARGSGEMPLAVSAALAKARNQGLVAPQLIGDWMIEPITVRSRPLWIWGAGHVGRAIVNVIAPLPEFEITWIDTDPRRFPDTYPTGVRELTATNPADLARYAPDNAEHLILTYSHTLDFELCHRLLGRDFAFVGLIGSDTKWARFRSRLRTLGHADAQIERICCPIGQTALGKHPQAIAVGVAQSLILHQKVKESAGSARGDRTFEDRGADQGLSRRRG